MKDRKTKALQREMALMITPQVKANVKRIINKLRCFAHLRNNPIYK